MALASDKKKSRSVLDRDKYTAELTSGQLIIAICSLLIFALFCFLLGVVVGRFEVSGHVVTASTATTTEESPVSESPASTPAEPITPPPPAVKSSVPAPTPAAETHRAPAPKRDSEILIAPPAEGTPKPASRPEPAPTSAPAATEPAPAPAPAPEPAAVAEPAKVVEPAPKSAAAPTPEPAKSTSSGPHYSIQLAAFGDTENATKAQQRLKANTGMDAVLIPSGKFVRLVVGDYPDKASAATACEELKKKAGFKDSYVITKPN